MRDSSCFTRPPQTLRMLPIVAALSAILGQTQALNAQAQSSDSATLPAVTITAPRLPAGRSQAGVAGLSDASAQTTPISIGSVSSEELNARGAVNLSSAMRFQSSVSDAYNTIGYIESLSIRGLPLNNATNFRRDGLPISNHSPLAMENKEGIETLMGVSGMQSGVSAPGGLVNYLLKRPTPSTLREAGLKISERGTVGVTADVGGRNEAKTFGYRLNAAIEQRRPMADNAPGSRQFISGFFDLHFDKNNRLELEFEHHRSKQISVPGVGLLDTDGNGVAETLPKVIHPRTNLNAQTWSQPFENVSTIASLRYERTLNDAWRFGVRANHQIIKTQDRLAFPDGCSSGSNYVYPGLCANYDVDLYDYRSENERRSMSTADLYASGRMQTGSLKHELNASLRMTRYRERYEDFQAYNYTGTVNVLAPVAVAGDGTKLDKNTLVDSDSKELSLSDVISFNEHWSTWLGLRHTRLTRASVRTDGSRATHYSQSFTTPWASLSYKTGLGTMAYLSLGEGVESEVVPNRTSLYSNAGQVLPALKSRQIELGIKQAVHWSDQQKGLFSAALFQITQTRAADVPDAAPATTATRIADGMKLRHRGLEVSYAGALSPSLSTQISATVLNARVTADANNQLVGKRTSNVAPFSASGQLTWQLAQDWRWRNAVTYFSSKPVGNDNIAKLPAAWQLDSGFSFQHKTADTQYTWQAGIDNVLDRRYWREAPTQYWGGTYLYPAQGRTFRVSLSAKF
jgi:iron complex outermembrane recepter protein